MVGIWWISSKWSSSKTSLKKGSKATQDGPEEIGSSFGDSTPMIWHIVIAVLFTITLIIKGFDSYTDWRLIDKAKKNLIKYEGLSEDYIPKDLHGYCNFSLVQSYRQTLKVTTVLNVLNDYRRLTTYATIIWYTTLAVKIMMLITGLKLYIRDNFTKVEKYVKWKQEMFMVLPLILCSLENIKLNAIAIKVSRYEFGELRVFLCALKTIGSGNCRNTTGSGICSIPELSFATDQELFINLLVSLVYSIWILSITPNPSYYLFSRYYYAHGKCEKTVRVILGIIAGFRLHVTNYASIWIQLLPIGHFPEPFSKAILGMIKAASFFLLIEVLMMFVTCCFSRKLIKKTENKDNEKSEETNNSVYVYFNNSVNVYLWGIAYMVFVPVLAGITAEFLSGIDDLIVPASYFYLSVIILLILSCANE